ncbi:PREDICTED: aspartic proteinase-like protein 2 [Tarenaya hassleriana]|uniref:aspartic proteinase-like protein 2 n=1 Tax=Tarenaya hassleriana TaxID=28532 RepID=UPI00053CA8F8|nr:PREDICTED: aspartic proteinase-like protein 2 [Tarenaya hassleriana]
MAESSPAGFIFAAVLLHATVVIGGFPAVLKLERLIPASHELDLSQLRARDAARHGRLLQSPASGVVDFSVDGDPQLFGLYYTKVKLGTPPREFSVQIDTGSDVLWVSCNSCNGCPKNSELQIQLSFFDPGASSSALLVSCSDRRCSSTLQSESGCSPNNLCSYTFQYGDGSGTSGYYVADFMSFNMVVTSTLSLNSSAPVVFGCSNLQTGGLQKPDKAVDGIFGLGRGRLSIVSQLSSQGLAPQVFSHCLKGDRSGGGIMVLGQIERPDTVYTPLVPSQPHYNVDLQTISVNGQVLPIDPSVFALATSEGTIIDTGTTLAYLPEEAYDPFLQAITNSVSQNARSIIHDSHQCYDIGSSAVDVFPQVTLNFAGGALMVLKPGDYLQYVSNGVSPVWCIGFLKMPGHRITILGDLVLKDRVVIYDLVHQRIGWADYDCSLGVNVSAARGGRSNGIMNSREWGENSSETCGGQQVLATTLLALLFHVIIKLLKPDKHLPIVVDGNSFASGSPFCSPDRSETAKV